MVATSQPLATQVGLDILKNGGNAIDAAIGANAAMGLMEPTGNGIGGDLFAIIWHEESGKLYALNASGRSPRGLSYEEMMNILDEKDRPSIPPYDLLSVSVPGAVDGWFEMHERFGSASMADILREPIWYAENGFPVSEAISGAWKRSARFLNRQPGAFTETFTIVVPKRGRFSKTLIWAIPSDYSQTKVEMPFIEGRLLKPSMHGCVRMTATFDTKTLTNTPQNGWSLKRSVIVDMMYTKWVATCKEPRCCKC
jgi:gamma-glutamyltranspeptidase